MRYVWGGLVIALAAASVLWGSRGGTAEGKADGIAPRYEAELMRSSETIASLRGRTAADPGSWLALEREASAHLGRARLTGSYDDYAAAEKLLDRAFAIAPTGSGPFLTRASLNFTLHRLDRVEADLDAAMNRVLTDDPFRARVEALRADVLLQQGRLNGAREGFERALRLHPGFTVVGQLAQCMWKQGDVAAAEAMYRDALASYHGESSMPVAWTHLQLGLMDLDAGRLNDALAHYRDADAAFDGWWLIEEHIAEIMAHTGRGDTAIVMYQDLIERTSNPEFMDALAGVLLDRGRKTEAGRLIEKARAAYEARLSRFPEATWGHALEHFLEFGDPETAVAIAEKNWLLRPNAEARDALRRAYEKAGRMAEAVALAARSEKDVS